MLHRACSASTVYDMILVRLLRIADRIRSAMPDASMPMPEPEPGRLGRERLPTESDREPEASSERERAQTASFELSLLAPSRASNKNSSEMRKLSVRACSTARDGGAMHCLL